MGIIATAIVTTIAENIGKPVVLQPGNCEWVTVVKTTNAMGWSIPLMVLFAGQVYLGSWFQNADIPRDWWIRTSPNSWTSNEIGVKRLQKYFEPHTTHCMVGKYRLLVLDGYLSHLIP
jgi:hypothetical protein